MISSDHLSPIWSKEKLMGQLDRGVLRMFITFIILLLGSILQPKRNNKEVRMKFLFIYNGGDVPAEKQQENIAQLWQWLDDLTAHGVQQTQFVANGGKSLTAKGTRDYDGSVFGISIIEADSMTAAEEIAKTWPELPYGGQLDILQTL